MHVSRVERAETPVLFCSGTGEAAAVAPALSERLEAALGDLRGRRFYGTHDPETCEYRACVEPLAGATRRAPTSSTTAAATRSTC